MEIFKWKFSQSSFNCMIIFQQWLTVYVVTPKISNGKCLCHVSDFSVSVTTLLSQCKSWHLTDTLGFLCMLCICCGSGILRDIFCFLSVAFAGWSTEDDNPWYPRDGRTTTTVVWLPGACDAWYWCMCMMLLYSNSLNVQIYVSVRSDIYPKWSNISRNCRVTFWLGHLSDQTGW